MKKISTTEFNRLPKSQIVLMEAAFEMEEQGMPWSEKITDWKMEETKGVSKAVEFGKKYKEDDERLKAIMKNIISNNGEFRP